MRYEFTDQKWTAIRPMLPNKPRGVPRADDRRVLNGIFWVLRSGAPWRELPNDFGYFPQMDGSARNENHRCCLFKAGSNSTGPVA
jgi:transposase